jgi:hypothetical protein
MKTVSMSDLASSVGNGSQFVYNDLKEGHDGILWLHQPLYVAHHYDKLFLKEYKILKEYKTFALNISYETVEDVFYRDFNPGDTFFFYYNTPDCIRAIFPKFL